MRGQPPRSWERPWPGLLAREFAARWTYAALLPRLERRGRWVSRLPPGGLLLYVLVRTAERYLTFTYLLPRLRRGLDDRLRWRAELVEQLGREPTDEEARVHQRRRWLEEHPDVPDPRKADQATARS